MTCEKDDDLRPMDIIMSLWIQLARGTPTPQLDPTFAKKILAETSAAEMKLFNHTIARLPGVILIVDGLDEIPRSHQAELVRLLEALHESNRNVRLLVTGRPYSSIVNLLEDWSKLQLVAEDLDLRKYMHRRIERPRWKILEGAALEVIVDDLVDKCEGTFLMAQLHMDELLRAQTPNECREVVANLPTTANEAYSRGLERLRKDSPVKDGFPCTAIRALFWVAFVQSPMTAGQLKQILAVDTVEKGYDQRDEPKEEVDILTGRLIIVNDNNNGFLSLSHKSLTDYLRDEKTQSAHFPNIQIHIHTTLLRIISPGCLDKLYAGSSQGTFLTSYPLCVFALENWGKGLETSLTAVPHLREKIETFLKARSHGWNNEMSSHAASILKARRRWTCQTPLKFYEPGFISGLHWAVFFNILEFIPTLVAHEEANAIENPIPTTPLGLAAIHGRGDAVDALLNHNVQISPADPHLLHPLYSAVFVAGNPAIVLKLLEHHADMAYRNGGLDQSPIDLAYTLHRSKIAYLLASYDDGYSSAPSQRLQLLVQGAFCKQLAVAIQQGLDVNLRCENGKMALDYARELGDIRITKTLIEAGAQENLTWPGVTTESCIMPVNFIAPSTADLLYSEEIQYKDRELYCGSANHGQEEMVLSVKMSPDKPPVRCIVFETVSRDQGWSNYRKLYGTYLGTERSRFEICAKGENWTSKRFRLQQNVHASYTLRMHTNIWNLGELEDTSTAKAAMMRSLQKADSLQVYAIADGGGCWKNVFSFVRVRMYSSDITLVSKMPDQTALSLDKGYEGDDCDQSSQSSCSRDEQRQSNWSIDKESQSDWTS